MEERGCGLASTAATSPLIEWLRSLAPNHRLGLGEAIRVAEHQANALLLSIAGDKPPLRDSTVTSLDAIQVRTWRGLPVSGMAVSGSSFWQIVLDPDEPHARQRVTLLHELKHVIDHVDAQLLYGTGTNDADGEVAEMACLRFAYAALMPGAWLLKDWQNGRRDIGDLAHRYQVSTHAMNERLGQLGLRESTQQEGQNGKQRRVR